MSIDTGASRESIFFQLGTALKAEFVKIFTLRSWWIGIVIITALNAYYTYVSGDLLNDLSSTLHGDTFTDYSGKNASFITAVHDALLAAPYQSMALFFPLLIAIIAGYDYRSGQISTSVLAQPRRKYLVFSQALATSTVAATLTLFLFLLSDAILLIILVPQQAIAVLVSTSAITMCIRLILLVVAMSILSHALTSIFRSSIPALIAIVTILVIGMTGLLHTLGLWAQNLMPLNGSQTFVFGHPLIHSSLTGMQGVLLLIAWLLASVVMWCVIFEKRDVA